MATKDRKVVPAGRTNLVEIDLLRAGDPMPVIGESSIGDYRTPPVPPLNAEDAAWAAELTVRNRA